MGIINAIKRKFIKNNKLEEFSIPPKFEITNQEIAEFNFYYRGKSLTSESELQKDGAKIDADIAKYMSTNKAKILNSSLNEFNIRAITVRSLPYNYGDISHSFKKYDSKDNISNMRHPSRILLESFEQNKGISLFNYLKVCIGTWMECKKAEYLEGNSFSFTNKTNFLQREKDNNNIEIAFAKDNNYFGTHENNSNTDSLYLVPNMFRRSDNPFKGIVIQNFTLSNDELNTLETMDKQFEKVCTQEAESFSSFEELAFKLNDKYLGRIAFIVRINGMVLIQGRDLSEKIIYTTILEQCLPDILTNMQRSPKNNVVNCNDNYNKTSVKGNESINQEQR